MENPQSKHGVQPRDSALAPFVTASPDEVRYAQLLRERIEQRYLGHPAPPGPARTAPAWTVGVD